MFATTLLTLALTAQIRPQDLPRVMNNSMTFAGQIGLYDAWRAQQSAAMQAQNDAYLRAEYQRQMAQQARLKARKAALKARQAPRPDFPDAPPKPVLSKQEREAQIQRNLARNRKP